MKKYMTVFLCLMLVLGPIVIIVSPGEDVVQDGDIVWDFNSINLGGGGVFLNAWKPDLLIEPADIYFSETPIIVGHNITIFADVHNIALGNATNARIYFSLKTDEGYTDSIQPETPIITGHNITIFADVHNIGLGNATDARIYFSLKTDEGYTDSIQPEYNDYITVNGSETVTASVNWTVPEDYLDHKIGSIDRGKIVEIRAYADYGNSIDEEDETNNEAIKSIDIEGPDLMIEPADIYFSETPIITGHNITIFADVHNIALGNATNARIYFSLKTDKAIQIVSNQNTMITLL